MRGEADPEKTTYICQNCGGDVQYSPTGVLYHIRTGMKRCRADRDFIAEANSPRKVDIEWRVVPDFPLYEINNLGDLRRIDTGRMSKGTLRGNKYYYQLHDGRRKVQRKVEDLVRNAFPDLDGED